jgi:hypothetical protein
LRQRVLASILVVQAGNRNPGTRERHMEKMFASIFDPPDTVRPRTAIAVLTAITQMPLADATAMSDALGIDTDQLYREAKDALRRLTTEDDDDT